MPSTFFETMPSAPRRQACANILREVFVQRMPASVSCSSRQRGLAVDERVIAQILTIVLDLVEAGCGLPEARHLGRRRLWGGRDSRALMLLQQERAGVEIAVDPERLRAALAADVQHDSLKPT